MSTLKVNTIQHSNGTDAITIDSTGNAAFSGAVTGTPLGNRNLIINGDMRIAQRASSVTSVTSNGYYTVDRWFSVCSPTSGIGTWTDEQSTDVPVGQGFTHSLKRTCTTADSSPASTDIAQVLQNIEGQNMVPLKKGTANAESVTLSFWVKSNKTGTYTVEWRDSNNNRHICASYNIIASDTWEKKTITFAGDTVSPFVYDNSSCGNIAFNLAAGSAFTSGALATSWASRNIANLAVGQVNLADSTSNYINITGVQLEVGENATEFEHRPYDMELQRCQRYYWRWTATRDLCAAMLASTVSAYGVFAFPVKMRANPTIATEATTNVRVSWSAGTSTTSGFAIDRNSDTSCLIRLTTSGLTAGQGAWYVVDGGSISGSAEL